MKKREILSLTLFITLILIIIMDNAIILPNQVLIAADLGIFFDAIGIIISIYTIINGISILIFGYLTDRMQRKKLLIIAGFMWSLTAILHIFVQELWHLILVPLLLQVQQNLLQVVPQSTQ